MKMKRSCLLLLLLAAVVGASAQQIDVTEALARAQKFLNGSNSVRKKAPSKSHMELAYSAETGEGTAFYVFNQNENDGFVIVGADELCRPILGYCEEGNFNLDQLPENVRWWLSHYSAQFLQAKKLGVKVDALAEGVSPKHRAPKASIANLMKTKWNQREPFNNAIPTLGAGYSKFVTGCVATAMAQVMKYHATPTTKGSGSKSYVINYNGTMPVTFSANFGATTYRWKDMLDEYSSNSYTQEQADAVATLVYHAGVSVDMSYNSSSSGAVSAKIPNALSTYFGYDKSMYETNRKYYSDEEWESLIYNELKAKRPVLYGGQDYKGGGGHEFVCHGYDATIDMYAFNWGWGGYCDGYYAMSGANGTGVLQPNGNGIGGAGEDAAYTSDQVAIINAMPDKGGDYYRQVGVEGNYVVSESSGSSFTTKNIGKENNTFNIKLNSKNLSSVATDFQLGVAFRNIISGEVICSDATRSCGSIEPGSWWVDIQYSFKPTAIIRNGEYEIIPTYRINSTDEWKPLLVENSQVKPKFIVTGRESAEQRAVTFTIDATTVPERQTLTINHDKLYNGVITYKSSNESVAKVSTDGVVTAIKEGTAKITAQAAETSYYFATTKTFDITVTPFELLPVDFKISNTDIDFGGKAQITWNNDYAGAVSFTVAPAGIVSVGNDGLVTALSSGTATITARATAVGDYKATEVQFDVTVADEYIEGIKISDFKVANKGYVTPTTVKFEYTVTNMRNEYNDAKFSMLLSNGVFLGTMNSALGMPSNYVWPRTTDMSGWSSYFESYITRNNEFTLTFLTADKSQTHVVDGRTSFKLIMCNDLSVTYNMEDVGWGTICLPFEAEVPAGLKAYRTENVNGSYLELEEVDFLEMGTPYIVSGTAGTYTFNGPDVPYDTPTVKEGLLTGVLADGVALQKGDYIMLQQRGTVGFFKIAEDAAKSATKYRAFIRLDDGSQLAGMNCLVITGDVPTNINNVEQGVTTEIYDLSGRRVNGVSRGINIVKMKDGRMRKVLIP